MAQRDRSQGFGFVYVDIAKLLTQGDELEKSHGPIPTGDAKTVNFNKDPQIAKPAPIPSQNGDSGQERKQAINQIRQNLDRLQSLHHKLHAMLADLNHITESSDKKKS